MKKAVMSYTKSLIVSATVYTALLFVFVAIALSKDIQDEYVYYLSFIPIAFATFSGGLICSKSIGKRGLVHGLLSQIIFFIILGCISLIISHKLNIYILIPLAACAFFGCIGGIAAVNMKKA